MKLYCSRCDFVIPAENIDHDRQIARCIACHTIFSFEENSATAGAGWRAEHADVPLPKGITITNSGYELLITMKWFRPMPAIFDIFLLGIWYLVVGSALYMGITRGSPQMVMMALPFLAGTLFMTYTMMTGYLNRTIVQVDANQIAIRHGPLPWRRGKQFDSYEITRIYCQEISVRSRHNYYNVCVALRNGKEHRIVTRLADPALGLYLVRQIKSFLGMRDRPVQGELGR